MKIALLLSIIKKVLSHPPHEDIYYSEIRISDLKRFGFKKDNGEPQGQFEDHRLVLKDGRSIHAKIYGNYISFHWDWVDPHVDGIEHLRRDAPFWYTLLCGVGAASLGALATAPSKKKDVMIKASIICGILGVIFGALTAEWE